MLWTFGLHLPLGLAISMNRTIIRASTATMAKWQIADDKIETLMADEASGGEVRCETMHTSPHFPQSAI